VRRCFSVAVTDGWVWCERKRDIWIYLLDNNPVLTAKGLTEYGQAVSYI
jgi:hypothetical protein